MIKFDDSYTNEQLAALRAAEEERMIQDQANIIGLPSVNLYGYTINPDALSVIGEKDARTAGVAAFELKQRRLLVATREPGDPKVTSLVEDLIKRRYEVVLYQCSQASLEHAWDRYKDISTSTEEKRGVFEINTKDIANLMSEIKSSDDVRRILNDINSKANVRRISETLELVFAGAMAMVASDIHIEPEKNAIRVRYRFDGVLHDVADLDTYIFGRLMSRLKLLSGMVLNTRAEAQDGRFTFDVGDRQIEIRSSVIPGALGESIVMRLLDPSLSTFRLDKMKLNPHIEAVIRNELKKPNGLIITTGPTGSGKTTALYACLQEAHEEGVKIITIENPVEYKLEGIVQTQIGPDYTFASGLRAILRQDPDIIMVGEIRDREVAETAIHAAQTGHLVFSTLHTNSAIAAFARLIDLGVDPRIMGSSINLILGQRLVRMLCNDCKKAYPATKEEIRLIEYIMKDHPYPIPVPSPLSLCRSVGCPKCNNTGYKGRAGIFEGILMDVAVEEVVIRDPREHAIKKAAKPQKIPNMLEDGIERVVNGTTSLAELERVIELPFVSEDETVIESKPLDLDESIPGEDNFISHVV